MRKPNIAVLFGGYSGESVVSEASAKNVFKAVDQKLFNPILVRVTEKYWQVELNESEIFEINKSDFSYIDKDNKKQSFDYALIVIHGAPGENGQLQAYFDMLNIPYSTGNTLSTALTFNKFTTNVMLKNAGIACGSTLLLKKGEEIDFEKLQKLGLPLFIKPCETGSSLGISKVKSFDALEKAILEAFKFDSQVLVEPFVEGRELSCGVYKTSYSISVEPIALPPTEIIPQNEFFDYESKYSGKSQEITPAQISKSELALVQETAVKVFKLFNCHGFIRVDMFLKPDSSIHVIEPNIVPGMTNESLIPQQFRAAGLDISELITELITSCTKI
jgi:D-alanine-D-alanine ligase